MESFNATLQEMIDCDMRAHLDSLTPSSVEVEAADVYDVSPWSQSHHQLVYSDLETPSLFVNPQTAVPHTKSYVLQGSNLISDEECDVQRFVIESTGDEKIQGGVKPVTDGVKSYPKPAYSYSCLIAMALKNSESGSLPVSEIYGFMIENFPYFKTAPNGWKNSVRHNLSLNKCFEKVDKSSSSSSYGNKERKGCLWTMNPSKINKMNEEVQKWIRKDPQAIKRSMARPETLELLSRGFQQEEKVELKKDVDVMSNNLQLDVSLPDLNLQTGIWDEFEAEVGFSTNSNILHLTNNNVNEQCKDAAVVVVRGSL